MRGYLKQLRKKNNCFQSDIASELGISTNYYCDIENGKRQTKMDVDIVFKLAKIFNVPVDYILTEEQKLQSAS